MANKATVQREPEDIIAGHLEVGHNDRFEVVINHPQLDVDEHGSGYLCFSPRQARSLANLLLKHADEALQEYRASVRDQEA